MDVWWHPRRRFLVVATAVVLLLTGAIALAAVLRQPVGITVRAVRIGVVDGPRDNQHVLLDASFFTPAGQGRLPAILLAPGFGETKYAVAPEAEYLARAGFAVLTWSPRGTGASGGQIGLDSPDYEVRDTSQLVTWLARQPRVLLDRPGDPRVGITGTSYGGGLALLAAAYDHRINAVVAQSAWHDLATALFPNAVGGGPATGVFARQWAGLLFTQGSAGFGTPLPAARPAQAAAVRQHVLCGRFLPSICAMYQQVAQAGQATPAAISLLQRSSPASVAGRMDAPTLLIQGEHDSLFGLDQANANYQAIRRNGAPGRHGLVRRRPRRRRPADRLRGLAHRGVVHPLARAGARPTPHPPPRSPFTCPLHSGDRPARLRGDPGARLRPVHRRGDAGHRHGRVVSGAGRHRPHGRAADRPAAGNRPPARRCAPVAVRLPRPRRPRRG